MKPLYLTGLDLGPPGEYTAFAIVERIKLESTHASYHYSVRHLERFPPGTSFMEVGQCVTGLLSAPDMPRGQLIVDQTGVGGAVTRMLCRHRINAQVRPVVVTNGIGDGIDDNGVRRIAKTELVGFMQVLLQSRRLVVANSLELAPTLVKELMEFKARMPRKNGGDLADWRERPHDDLVLAVAVAVWMGEYSCWDIGIVC